MKTVRPLISLLAAIAVSAAEVPISQPKLVPLDSTAWQVSAPAVAAGDGFLVTWNEALGYSTVSPVKVRTYDPDGRPRQDLAISIANGSTPRAFWNGSEYVIVYANGMPKYAPALPLPALTAIRVRPDGTVVEDSDSVLASARYRASVLALAWDGTNALVAVTHDSGNHLLLLDRNGALVEDTPVDYTPGAIAARPGGGFFVLRAEQGSGIAAGGDRFAIVANVNDKSGGVTAAIVDANGAELERFTLSQAGGHGATIVWDGRAWVAAFAENGALCTARFTRASDVVRDCKTGGSASAPALAVGTERLFEAWKEGAQLVTDSGLASSIYATVGDADATVDDTGLLAAWVEHHGAAAEIRTGGIANDGTLRPEHRLTATIEGFGRVLLSRAGDRTLLLWTHGRALQAVEIDETGAPADTMMQFRDGSSPAVAARGDERVIVWAGDTGIESLLLDRNLQTGAFESFGGFGQQYEPAIAATPTGYLVAWHEIENGIGRIVIEPLDDAGRRFKGGNRVVEKEHAPLAYPKLACNAGACLLTWFGATNELWCALVSHDGVRLSEDRLFEAHEYVDDTVVKVQAGDSFMVYRNGAVTPVSAAGEPGPTLVWHNQRIALANVVDWRGRPAAVYNRGQRLFAFDFASRARSVRH